MPSPDTLEHGERDSIHSGAVKQVEEVLAFEPEEVIALEAEAPNHINPTESAIKKFRESDAGDGTKREDQYIHGIQLYGCIAALFLCLFLVALDQTIVSTILPVVGNKFNAYGKVGWLTSGFFLTLAVFIQPFGKLSIIVGRRYAMIVGIILFEAGSLMCALSSSMNILIGGRVLAGTGAAGCQGMVFVIVSEILPIHQRPIGMAIMSLVFAVASVVGPVVGGLFTTHVTWRWAFYINLPIGGLAAVLFILTFRPPFPKGSILAKLKTYDYVGTFLLISGLVLFLLALTFGGNDFSWNSAAVILCFILGGLLVGAFGVWNVKFAPNPLIPWEIIKIPEIVAAYLSVAGNYAFFMLVNIYLVTYFQIIHDKSALSSGLHLLPLIVSVVIASSLGGFLIQKTRMVKEQALLGGVLGPIGAGLLCLLKVDSSKGAQIGLLIVGGVSAGCQMQPALIAAQISAPKTPGSTILATTLVNFFRSIMAAIAANLGGAVYTASLQNKYNAAIKKETDPSILSQFAGRDGRDITANNAFIKELTPDAQRWIKEIIMSAIKNTFYLGLAFTILSLIGSVFMANKRLPKHVASKREDRDDSKEDETEISEGTKKVDKSDSEASSDNDSPKEVKEEVPV